MAQHIAWFLDIGLVDRPTVGGKGASLGELVRAGIAVPPGFVVRTGAFENYLQALERDTPVRARVDLVHCQEVVEHIEEQYLDNLLESMCSGRFILMTNALPGQGGHHHVNEQPTEYWIHPLANRGCQVMVEDTRRIRKLAAMDGATYLAQTGLLLANTRRA